MIGARSNAVILVVIIKMFTDEDTSLGTAFLASLGASIASQILSAVALATVEST